ncbi:MAG: ABC transporter ATP-binding protein [Myxococcota bacterium]
MGWSARLRGRLGDFALDVALEGGDGVLALVGPNGSGKTTVLRALTGAVVLEQAEIVVDGRVLDGDGVAVPIEDRRVGYVPQGYGLFPHLTALDNAAFALSVGPRRLSRDRARERALGVLEALDCADLAARRVRRLSGGEQQRVALARALCADPALLLLDEPLSALDATTRRTVRRVLARDLATLGRPTVLVTHDVRDIAAFEATVAVLEAGRVVQTGRLAELAEAPATDFVAELVH